jgi:8-oxo-dGTP pyrophosphatase MutT (NUDIX family)
MGDRIEYYHDRTAPRVNSVAPTAFAVVRDDRGRLLLVRRVDTKDWELPGGRVEAGESAAAAAERETAEESGVTVMVTRLSGLYSDPGHVMVYPATSEARQEFAVCLHALPLGGTPRADLCETSDVAWVEPERLDAMQIHPSVRLRIHNALTHPEQTHLG